MRPDHPTFSQTEGLRSLWKKAFGDGDAFLDLFFSAAFSPHRCRCITEDGKPVAALYWFDCICQGSRFAYVYAVATDPDYRNRGLCRFLIEDVRAFLTHAGYSGILLVPQSDSLSAMYRKMGFMDCTRVTEFTAPAEDHPLSLRRLSTEEFGKLRSQLLPSGGVIQEGENLAFLGGFCLFYTGPGWLAAVTLDGDILHCHELLGDPDAAYGLVAALGCREGTFRIPGSDRSFAQYLPLVPHCPKPGYFGLAFD